MNAYGPLSSGRRWASILFVGAGAWGCGPSMSASVSPPAPEVSATATTKDEPAATAKVEPTAAPAAPVPAPPLQVRDAGGVRAFFAELCRRHAAKDEAWLRAHVRFPLHGSERIEGEGENVLLGGLLVEQPGDLVRLRVCEAPLSDASKVQIDAASAPEVTARFDFEGHPHRATFDVSGGEPVLTEVTFVLRERGEPQAPKKVRAYSLEGNVIAETGGLGSALEAFMLAELKQHPACLRAYVARNKESAAIRIRARKREGEAASVRVHASTVARASLLACLERHLDAAVAGTFRGKAFEVEYMLRLAVPLQRGEEDDGNVVKAIQAP
ncbi:Hypothetical protein A7982_11192 [Minicystis rosea]|nr:Hypothetical protein A7982_11192 [Minicystis rosea]